MRPTPRSPRRSAATLWRATNGASTDNNSIGSARVKVKVIPKPKQPDTPKPPVVAAPEPIVTVPVTSLIRLRHPPSKA